MTAKSSKVEVKKMGQSRTLFLYDQAKTEDWENYAQELQKRFEVKETLKQIQKEEQSKEERLYKMNSIWDVIEEVILIAANKHISKKKIYNTVTNRKRSQKERQ